MFYILIELNDRNRYVNFSQISETANIDGNNEYMSLQPAKSTEGRCHLLIENIALRQLKLF